MSKTQKEIEKQKQKEMQTQQLAVINRQNEITARLWSRGIQKLTGVNVFEETRRRRVVTYRALHVYMLSNTLKWTLQKIRNFYRANGKAYDHATVMHALKMFDVYCFYDSNIMNVMNALIKLKSDEVSILQGLHSKLNYIDEEFYDNIQLSLNGYIDMTAAKNSKLIEEEKERKKEEKFYAL